LKKTFRTIHYRSLSKGSPYANQEMRRTYIFTIDKDITAEFNGVYYPEDEDWMMSLTYGDKPLLKWTNMPEVLVANIAVKSNRVMLTDIIPAEVLDYEPSHRTGKTQSTIDAEILLAQVAEQQEFENRVPIEIVLTELDKAREESLRLSLLLEARDTEIANLKALPIVENIVEELPILVDEIIEEIEEVIEPIIEDEVIEEIEKPIVEEIDEVIEPIIVPIIDSENLSKFKVAFKESKDLGRFIRAMKLEFGVEELTEIATELGVEYEGSKADMLKILVKKLG
jgi:hypothetical protein